MQYYSGHVYIRIRYASFSDTRFAVGYVAAVRKVRRGDSRGN